MSDDENFIEYFVKKYKITSFATIKKDILDKIKNYDLELKKYNYASITEFQYDYLLYVFGIAVTDYWELKDEQIKEYLTELLKHKPALDEMNVTRVKEIHKDAIIEIQKYLQNNNSI